MFNLKLDELVVLKIWVSSYGKTYNLLGYPLVELFLFVVFQCYLHKAEKSLMLITNRGTLVIICIIVKLRE